VPARSLLTVVPLGLTATALAVSSAGAPPQPAAAPQASAVSWRLSWSDEFDGPAGSAPDPAKWAIDTGGNGWGNNELQFYTSRPENVQQRDGQLVITARKETFAEGAVTRGYTSARIKTAERFAQRYGRFEARLKLPTGRGIWPAFWMLGDNFPATRWPACGEIDIMEHVGHEPARVHSNLHGPGYSGSRPISASYTLPAGRVSDAFHLFAIEWEADAIRAYVDDTLYNTRTPANLPAGTRWVYDRPFFMLLNLAVGGNWPGSPDDSTVFPQQLLVDYVRVYVRP
jgi:beta-glucanase (GH16 family)